MCEILAVFQAVMKGAGDFSFQKACFITIVKILLQPVRNDGFLR